MQPDRALHAAETPARQDGRQSPQLAMGKWRTAKWPSRARLLAMSKTTGGQKASKKPSNGNETGNEWV